ncbi:predicted protein [Naegleria gruberi]|uniref:Predicted protein n=1 Tax=Naegleria gruberi TaxID=5762 RepID=D2VRN2_NAEGR|nr:uncharacterized protein NAEGRDRAFT_71645 [Naegleria gruberi]EFC40421.1 predicted protein [Naegleria gruberi]|eukprot:XP_002673165.1 predicted protein [Naegleria gruberi strain NEG-M]
MSQRNYQLRTYTLKTKESALQYRDIWYDHVESLKVVGIQTHGIFIPVDCEEQVIALVSYNTDKTVEEYTLEYMNSEGFKKDVKDFDISNLVKVETREMTAIKGSPLQ